MPSPSPGRRSGGRWSAAPRPTSSGRPRSSPRCTPPPRSDPCAAGRWDVDPRRCRRRPSGRPAVLAGHPDQSLSILADPTRDESRLLGAFEYLPGKAMLHTDATVLPRGARARASWNYRMAHCRAEPAGPDQLRHQPAPADRGRADYVVTLNANRARWRPGSVLARMTYAHPCYTRASVAAQRELHDQHRPAGVRRGLAGLGLPRGRLRVRRPGGRLAGGRLVTRASPRRRSRRECSTPRRGPAVARSRGSIRHDDAPPHPAPRPRVDRRFAYRTYYWLVDLDAPPDLPRALRPLVRFEARDHFGDPSGRSPPMPANCSPNTADRRPDPAADLPAGRRSRVQPAVAVLLPARPSDDAAGEELVAVVAEVHNTYGGRHVYVLRPGQGRAGRRRQAFYVSPFLPMGGTYLMRTPLPGERSRWPSPCARTGRRRSWRP